MEYKNIQNLKIIHIILPINYIYKFNITSKVISLGNGLYLL